MEIDIRDKFIRYSRRARNLWIRRGFKKLDLDCYVSSKATLWGRGGISLEAGVVIQPYAVLQCTLWNRLSVCAGSIEIGRGTSIQPFAYLNSDGGTIEIGENCSLNPYCVLYGSAGGLKIGNFVRIAAQTVIIPSNHNFDRTSIPIHLQGSNSKGIVIHDDVWIGAGVKILDGVTIDEGAVIGAGAVVTKDVPAYSVNVGVPAQVIGFRKSRIDNESDACIATR